MLKIKNHIRLFVLISFAAASVFIISGCRKNAAAERVYVIIIDGLRPDRLAEAASPEIDKLIKRGAFSDSGRAIIPTATRVNFVSIPTGTYPDRHLVFGGSYRNENWQFIRTAGPTMEDAQKAVPVPTIFEVLEKRGIKTAYFVNKGYELVGGRGASVQEEARNLMPADMWRGRYDNEIDGSEQRALDNWLSMDNLLMEKAIQTLKEDDIRFLIMNLGGNDYVGHKRGPQSDEYLSTITNADRLIGEFVAFLKQQGWYENTALIIGSDHGFTQVGNPQNIVMPSGTQYSDTIQELEEQQIVHNAYARGGMSFAVYLQNPDEDFQAAFQIISGLPYVDKVYTRHETPGAYGTLADINSDAPGRSGEFFVDLHPDYTLNFDNKGQHGSSRDDDVRVPFILYGKNIKQGVRLETPENTDIAPTALALFGIDHRKHLRAQGRVLEEALER